MRGFRVFFTNDQTGIPDRHHTKIELDTVHYDMDGWWDPITHRWLPQFTVPTLVTVVAHLVWGSPDSYPSQRGYAKAWSHWQVMQGGLVVDAPHGNQGEGRTSGPLSPANESIFIADQRLVQPGEFMHVAFIGFAETGGNHVIQSGAGDDPDGTQRRSFLAVSW